MRNQLKIHQYANGSFVDFEIDLFDDEPFPITKSITDVQKIDNRMGDYTKTIRIPGTANNHKIFSDIFNLNRVNNRVTIDGTTENFNTDFIPSLKADATMYKNGIVQITGYLQLTQILITEEKQVEYEVVIIGRFANLFQDIARLMLSDIDLSEYNHMFGLDAIYDSWSAPKGAGYVYGMIEYGHASNQVDYYATYLAPGVYVKTIFDKIFSDAGYRYSSSFLNSDRFKALVIPYTGKRLRKTAQQVTDRVFEMMCLSNTGATLSSMYTIDYDTVVKDTSPGGITLPQFNIQNQGYYSFEISQTIDFNNTGATDWVQAHVRFKVNGYVVQSQAIWIAHMTPGAHAGGLVTFNVPSMWMNYLDEIKVELLVVSSTNLIESNVLAGAYIKSIPGADIVEGDTIVLSDTLASDIEQTSFLTSIIQMFNLYFEVDKLDDHKLIIEPRDDFFINTVTDLTDYVDHESEVKILPMGATQFKYYNYRYAEDKDQHNADHQNKFADTYGNRKFEIVNDFVSQEYKSEVIFAATPLSESPTQHNRIQSYIWFKDSNGVRVETTAKPRILYYGGLFTCLPWTLHDRPGGTTFLTLNSYPYIGHLDSWIDPQFDLSFGVPKEVQYYAYTYTDKNLFSLYHEKGIREITDPDSKIVEMKLHLNEVQQNKLSFREYYFIDQQYYRLYKVDYDGNNNDLTTIQFLKLKSIPAPIPTTEDINGGDGSFESGENYPVFKLPTRRNNNAGEPGVDSTVYGEDNNVRGDGTIVNSSGNSVGADGASIFGGGNNTVTLPGCTLIGCEEYETVQEDSFVANNILQPDYFLIELTAPDVSGIFSAPREMLPKFTGYWTEVVDAYATVFGFGDEPVAFGAGVLSLQYLSSTIINFSSGIAGATTSIRERGALVDNVTQLNEGVYLRAPSDFGSSGTGRLLIEIHYRKYLMR